MWLPTGIFESANFSLREGSKKKFDTALSARFDIVVTVLVGGMIDEDTVKGPLFVAFKGASRDDSSASFNLVQLTKRIHGESDEFDKEQALHAQAQRSTTTAPFYLESPTGLTFTCNRPLCAVLLLLGLGGGGGGYEWVVHVCHQGTAGYFQSTGKENFSSWPLLSSWHPVSQSSLAVLMFSLGTGDTLVILVYTRPGIKYWYTPRLFFFSPFPAMCCSWLLTKSSLLFFGTPFYGAICTETCSWRKLTESFHFHNIPHFQKESHATQAGSGGREVGVLKWVQKKKN